MQTVEINCSISLLTELFSLNQQFYINMLLVLFSSEKQSLSAELSLNIHSLNIKAESAHFQNAIKQSFFKKKSTANTNLQSMCCSTHPYTQLKSHLHHMHITQDSFPLMLTRTRCSTFCFKAFFFFFRSGGSSGVKDIQMTTNQTKE